MIFGGLLADDPVDQFDRRWHDRDYHRTSVRAQLSALEWKDGVTIGTLLDDRCASSRFGERCERERGHIGNHLCASGGIEWGGR